MTEHCRPPMATIALERARELRVGSTDAERKLWQYLRAGQLGGLKFRRQHQIPPYTVDFYCHAAKLVIELDGSQHNEQTDFARTYSLKAQGLTVLRFWDNEVLTQIDAVVGAIWNAVAQLPLTPTHTPAPRWARGRSSSREPMVRKRSSSPRWERDLSKSAEA